ncbi:hypothetical protein MATL_G00016430 [Megalops atlanticus]|uniref:Uncharacterized protein n=1 Tax=Megalops atlanticus TaxID=7932 RepID=A0A9D3QHZ7_MEGAT|nr:hypothetical protein MATL_G00016430 [Megalops atlanticus]
MNGSAAASTVALSFNRTAVLGTAEREMNDAVHEFKVFNITITSLALCILTFTGVFCSISYHTRRRQRKQAQVYESAVGRDRPEDAVAVRTLRRTPSLRNPFSLLRRQDAARDGAGIYFIYSNPIAAAATEGEDSPTPAVGEGDRAGGPTRQAHAGDAASSGIILDPSTFYMQL